MAVKRMHYGTSADYFASVLFGRIAHCITLPNTEHVYSVQRPD
jgi:hypothetical protein